MFRFTLCVPSTVKSFRKRNHFVNLVISIKVKYQNNKYFDYEGY